MMVEYYVNQRKELSTHLFPLANGAVTDDTHDVVVHVDAAVSGSPAAGRAAGSADARQQHFLLVQITVIFFPSIECVLGQVQRALTLTTRSANTNILSCTELYKLYKFK